MRTTSFSSPTNKYMNCGEAAHTMTTTAAANTTEILKPSLNPIRHLSKFLAPAFCAVKTLSEAPRLTAGIVSIVSILYAAA